jgi:hypothetical protein
LVTPLEPTQVDLHVGAANLCGWFAQGRAL